MVMEILDVINVNNCICGGGGKDHCPFDHGIHQFYEGHYLGDTYIKDKDTDYCLKCGKKK